MSVKYIEYIGGTGTQFIDTGVSAANITKVELGIIPQEDGLEGDPIYGAAWGTDGYFLIFYQRALRFHSFGGSVDVNYTVGEENTIVTTQTTITSNGTEYAVGTTGPNTDNTLFLFQCNGLCGKFKMLYCTIYENGTPVRDYRPCLDSEGVACLYDNVNEEYVYNAGTGSFFAGPSLDGSVNELNYIESSGTQYIDTGIAPSDNIKIQMECQLLDNTSNPAVFGSRDGSSQLCMLYWGTNAGAWYFAHGTAWPHFPTSTNSLSKNQIEITNTGGYVGDVSATWDAYSYSTTYPIYLFCANNTGNVALPATMRLMWCKIYLGETLVKDYIAAVDNNGTVCLYDKVNREYVYNAGTGSFKAGPPADGNVKFIEFLESDGTAYFPTGLTPTEKTKIEAKAAATDGHCYMATASGTYRFGLYLLTTNKIDMAYGTLGYKGSVLTGVSYPAVVTLENGQATANGAVYSFAAQSAFTAGELMLFSEGTSTAGKGRVYYFKYWEDGELVLSLRPALDLTGTPCFYDEISQSYQYGTGTFTAGNEYVDRNSVTFVKSLGSDGSQFINTNIIPNQDTRVVCEFDYSSEGYVFGAENAYKSNSFDLYTRLAVYNATSSVFTALSTGTKHTADFNKNVVSVDGSVKYTFTYAAFNSGMPLYLFCVNQNGSGVEGVVGNIYYCKIYNNGVLVRYYKPALLSNGTPGLYDEISGTFAKNSGTGAFTCGAAVTPRVRYLKYLQTDGLQAIDTKHYPTPNTRVVMDAQAVELSTIYFGCRNANAKTAPQAFVALTLSAGGMRSDYFGSSLSITDVTVTDRQTVDMDKNICTVGGISVTHPVTTETSDYSLYLFGINQLNGLTTIARSLKVYSCQIYENEVLLHNYRPAIDDNGVSYLYDAVTQTNSYNIGTGEFVAGPETADPSQVRYVEYIESSGTQYIDTGVLGRSGLQVDIEFQLTSAELSSAWMCVFGCTEASTITNTYNLWFSNANTFLYYYNNKGTTITAPSLDEHHFISNGGTCVFDGTSYSNAGSAFTSAYSLYLFALSKGGTAADFAKVRIKSCKISDPNGVLLRDYRPCVAADGTPCMYDEVSQEYFFNKGTGSFTAGPIAIGTMVRMPQQIGPAPTPPAAFLVEYLESDGNQYIDTGFKPNNNTRVLIDAVFTVSTSTKRLYGARSGSMSNAFAFDASSGGYYLVEYAAEQKQFNASIKYTERFTIDHNKNVVTLNGQNSVTCTTSTFSTPYNLVLFGINNAGNITGSAAKIYSCQIYDNGTLIHDYKPCVTAEGVACLYDVIAKKFVYNAGTGTFTPGALTGGTISGDLVLDYSDNFADNDWATINAVCAAGIVPATWKVGDQKAMTINDTSFLIDIIGIQHDEYADGSGKAPFTFQLHDNYYSNSSTVTIYPMNSTNTNKGGWKDSAMRNTHLPSIMSLMPSEVQAGIREVNKLTSAGDASSTIVTSADKLFLLSEIELNGSVNYSFAGEGTQYAYYAAGNSKIHNNGSSNFWWLRSPYTYNSSNFCYVNGSGYVNATSANDSFSASFAFCLGNKTQSGGGGGGSTTPSKFFVSMENGHWLANYCYIVCDGETMIGDNVFEVNAGATITVYCRCATYSGSGASWIKFNGVEVARAGSGSDKFITSYTFTVTSNTRIQSGTATYSPDGLNSYRYYTATITTE